MPDIPSGKPTAAIQLFGIGRIIRFSGHGRKIRLIAHAPQQFFYNKRAEPFPSMRCAYLNPLRYALTHLCIQFRYSACRNFTGTIGDSNP